MAIQIDERAQAAIGRRRARGRDTTILVHLASVPARGGMQQLVARWAPRVARIHPLVSGRVGGVTLQLCARVARYADWHDLTISARRLGPIEHLTVVDEPRVVLELQAWEQTHPRPVTS